MADTDNLAAAGAFVRSCNVLLKQAALYGLKHKRSAAQFELTWSELRKALAGGAKLALAVAGERLMLNGVHLNCGTAERSLAGFFVAAGIGRIDFYPTLCPDEFAVLISIFSSVKPPEVLAKIRPELGKTIGNVRLHEFRVLDTYTESSEESGGASGLDLAVLLSDPHKLLQLIDAVDAPSPGGSGGSGQGGAGSGSGAGGGSGGGTGGGSGSATVNGARSSVYQEGSVLGMIRWLAEFAGAKPGQPDGTTQGDIVLNFPQSYSTQDGMNAEAQPRPEEPPSELQQALQKILPPRPPREMRGALLLQLAEHVALRAVNEKYQREGLNVTAIQQMLERMNHEIDSLRTVLHVREEEMGRAGLPLESSEEVLDHQFWKGVPDSAKRKVLLSADAWVVPPHIIRAFVQPLIAARAEIDTAMGVLRNYTRFLESDEPDARKTASAGIGKLADLYSRIGQLDATVQTVGELLARGPAAEFAPALKSSFVLLGQEAASARDYSALDEWLYALEAIEQNDAAMAAAIRSEVPVEARVPEMVRAAIQEPQPPEALIEVLKRVPDPTARFVIEQFAACTRREEGTRLARVLSVLGPVSIDPVREMLLRGSPAEAVSSLGLLTVLEPDFLRQELPARLKQWNRALQDTAVRQISGAGSDERGSLLLEVIDGLDPFVIPSPSMKSAWPAMSRPRGSCNWRMARASPTSCRTCK